MPLSRLGNGFARIRALDKHRKLWLGVLALLAIWGAALAIGGRGVDLGIYLRAASHFWDGTDIYQSGEGREQYYVFKYAPATVWFFLPLCALPFKLAALVWNLGVVAAFGYVVKVVSCRKDGSDLSGGGGLSGFWPKFVATLALGNSIYCELFYGQVNLFLLFLLVASAHAAEQDRPFRAGTAFALAVALKPQMAIFVLFFLLRRRLKPLLYALVAGVLLWIPVLLRYGPSETVGLFLHWREVLTTTTPPWILGYNTQGLPTALVALFAGGNGQVPSAGTVVLAMGIGTAVIAAPILWMRPLTKPLLALLCLGGAMLTPHAWIANFVMAWPLLFFCLTHSQRQIKNIAFGISAALFAMMVVIQEGLLGRALFRGVMLTRPYTIVMLLLMITALVGVWLDRRAAARSGLPPGQDRTECA